MASDPLRNGSIFKLFPAKRQSLRKETPNSTTGGISESASVFFRTKIDELYRATPMPFMLQGGPQKPISNYPQQLHQQQQGHNLQPVTPRVESAQPSEASRSGGAGLSSVTCTEQCHGDARKSESPNYFCDSPLINTRSATRMEVAPHDGASIKRCSLATSSIPVSAVKFPKTPASPESRPAPQSVGASTRTVRQPGSQSRRADSSPDTPPQLTLPVTPNFWSHSPNAPIPSSSRPVTAPFAASILLPKDVVVDEMVDEVVVVREQDLKKAAATPPKSSLKKPDQPFVASSASRPTPGLTHRTPLGARAALASVGAPLWASDDATAQLSGAPLESVPAESLSARKLKRSARGGPPSLLALIKLDAQTEPAVSQTTDPAHAHAKIPQKGTPSSASRHTVGGHNDSAPKVASKGKVNAPVKARKKTSRVGMRDDAEALPTPNNALKRVKRSSSADRRLGQDESSSSTSSSSSSSSSSSGEESVELESGPSRASRGRKRTRSQNQAPAPSSSRQLLAASLAQAQAQAQPKGRSKEWTRSEIIALYQCHRDTDVNTSDFWTQVSRKMAARSVDRSAEECEQRFFKVLQDRDAKQKKNTDLRIESKLQAVHAKLMVRNAALGPKDKTRQSDKVDAVGASTDKEPTKKSTRAPRLTKQDFTILSQAAARSKRADDVFEKHPVRQPVEVPAHLPVPTTPSDASVPPSPQGDDELSQPLFTSNRRHEFKRKIAPTLIKAYDLHTLQARKVDAGKRPNAIQAAVQLGSHGLGLSSMRQQSRKLEAAITTSLDREYKLARKGLSDDDDEEEEVTASEEDL